MSNDIYIQRGLVLKELYDLRDMSVMDINERGLIPYRDEPSHKQSGFARLMFYFYPSCLLPHRDSYFVKKRKNQEAERPDA